MNRWVRRAKQGFTLIELMIVVAIIGILAVLAIYGVRKYMANAKTAEARNSLGQIGKDQSAEFEKESMGGATLSPTGTAGVSRSLCATSVAVPTAATSIQGKKYQSSQAEGADWGTGNSTTGWPCLKFSMDAPQYYMYSFATVNPSAAAGTFKAFANGDMNGDGVLSTFELDGVIQATMNFSLAPNLTDRKSVV